MNDDMGSWRSSILVSFVAGGLTGAAVALLLAPQSGQGTRSRINQRIRDGVDRARETRQRIARQGRGVQEGAPSHLGGRQEDF